MPLQSMRKCAAVDMRPPLPNRVHLGGGLISALPGHANKLSPLRVSAPADMILSEYKEPAKGEDGTPWVFNISTWKSFGFFFNCIVAVACSATLVFVCNLGITHYHSVFQFLSATATGNSIAVLLLLLGPSVKIVFDKIDAAQLETKKELQSQAKRVDAAQLETKKELQSQAKRVDAALQSQSRLITQILTSLAKMETNIAWMRGDHGLVNLKHGQPDQGTKSSTTESLGDEDSSATNPY